MRKRYFLFLLVLFFELLAFALPAKKGVITVNQPDGTQLRIEGHGDENFHYITTEDGFLVKKNNDGIYEYAEFAEQRIKPLGIKARSIGERIDAEKMFLKRTQKSAITISHEQETSMRKIAAQQIQDLRPQKVIGQRNYPQRGLVILVNFQDVAFSPQNTLAEMDSMLNGVNYTYEGATASARKYFFDQSSGAYNPTFDVVGPVTLSNNVAFYGGNDASGNDIRPDSMVIEACRLADEQLGVDFSRYDNEGDGVIDFVFIVYAGYGEASNYSDSPDLIWQHAWYIYQGAGKIWFFDGKLLNIYACSSELSGTVGSNRRDGIGAFCHEFSHVLGLPDTYATNGASHFTLGAWNIMDQGPYNNNGKTPPSYSAYERFFMGWLTPTYLSRTQNVTIGELQSTNEAYLFCEDGTHNLDGETPNPELFYMFENRQKVGWDAYLPGHGLLVTKINYNSSSWTRNAVNNNSAAMGIDILEADGRASRMGDAGDTYPGSTFCRQFYIGSRSFSSIVEEGGQIRFDACLGVDSIIDESEEETAILILPGKNLLQIRNIPAESNIFVYNLFGQLVHSEKNNSSETSISMKRGIYLVQIDSPFGSFKQKTLVE